MKAEVCRPYGTRTPHAGLTRHFRAWLSHAAASRLGSQFQVAVRFKRRKTTIASDKYGE